LEKGADTNAKTSSEAIPKFDGLSPLDGAVSGFWGSPIQLNEQREKRNSIVLSLLKFGTDPSTSCVTLYRYGNSYPIWMNQSCGVDTTIALIDHGMDLHARSDTTILHHWASLPYDYSEQDSLTIVKILVEKGVDLMIKDQFGLSPILIAMSACGVQVGRLNLMVLDYLLERDNISTNEKIEAMEIAGASILCDPGNTTLFPKAFDYWIRATHLRQKKKKRFHPYRKTLQENSGGPVEWITWDQLERVIQHPSEYGIQSFLIKLRILSSRSYAAVELFVIKCLNKFGIMRDEGKFVELFDILGATFDTFLVDRERDEVTETQYTESLFSFLVLLFTVPEMLKEMPGCLDALLRQWGPHQLGSFVLNACKVTVESVNLVGFLRFLLKAGADPDVVDKDGNGPLHLVAQMNCEQSEAAGCLLLGFGAKLHRPNKAGKTAMDLWIECNEKEGDDGVVRLPHRPDWCRAVPKLQCLSARCARAHQVPNSKLPTVFHSYIRNH